LLRAKRHVIAEAGGRLMPHACEASKTEEAAPILSAIRSDQNRLFGTVPEREIREDRNNHLEKITGSTLHIFGSQRGGDDPTICLRYASARGTLRFVENIDNTRE
jgi:hypothetical protein